MRELVKKPVKRLTGRIRKKLRSRAGFTLIEMVAATALVAIFFSIAATVLPNWFASYKGMVRLSYARQIATSVMNAIEADITFADAVRMSDEKPGVLTGRVGKHIFEIPMQDGDRDMLIEGLVYDEHYYMDMDVSLSFAVEPGKYCTVTVDIKDKSGSEIMTKERAIPLVGTPPA